MLSNPYGSEHPVQNVYSSCRDDAVECVVTSHQLRAQVVKMKPPDFNPVLQALLFVFLDEPCDVEQKKTCDDGNAADEEVHDCHKLLFFMDEGTVQT
jgi:hypothetical protein